MRGFDTLELLTKFRYHILFVLVGLILLSGGIFFLKMGSLPGTTKVEVLSTSTTTDNPESITVEIAGEVIKPGVYKMPYSSRIDDLLILSGGFSAGADRGWTDKYLNRAGKLTDGQKIYIPGASKQTNTVTAKDSGVDQSISTPYLTDSNKLVNINTAELKELDSLRGIGQTYGQSIVEHRPYSNVDELLSKGVLKQSVFNKVKNLVTVY